MKKKMNIHFYLCKRVKIAFVLQTIILTSVKASHIFLLNVIDGSVKILDWLQSLKQFFINVSYHILVANLTLMALF